jgi:hypothetical protein
MIITHQPQHHLTRQHTITTAQGCRFISCFRASRLPEASYSDSRLHTSASFVTVRVSRCRMSTCSPRDTAVQLPIGLTVRIARVRRESYLHYASSVAHRDTWPRVTLLLCPRAQFVAACRPLGEDTCTKH